MISRALSRRQQQTILRWVKRTPGYGLLINEVLPRVRRDPLLSDLAHRVFAPRSGVGQVDVPLLAGRHLTGPDVDLLPVIALVAIGLPRAQVEDLIDAVASLQQQHPTFRPLLISDQPVFSRTRAHAYPFEHVLPEESFARPEEWLGYLAERLIAIVDDYQVWHLSQVQGGTLDLMTVALIRHLHTRLPHQLRVRVHDARSSQE